MNKKTDKPKEFQYKIEINEQDLDYILYIIGYYNNIQKKYNNTSNYNKGYKLYSIINHQKIKQDKLAKTRMHNKAMKERDYPVIKIKDIKTNNELF